MSEPQLTILVQDTPYRSRNGIQMSFVYEDVDGEIWEMKGQLTASKINPGADIQTFPLSIPNIKLENIQIVKLHSQALQYQILEPKQVPK